MNSSDIKVEEESENGSVLLPNDLDFLITRTGGVHETRVNVTYRWPRMVGDNVTLLVATTTMDAQNLSGLRVEVLNDQYFVVNDKSGHFNEQVKFSVQSEAVGHCIVKGLINEFSPKVKAVLEKDLLNVPKKYWRLNEIAEKFVPLIMVSCVVLLSASASYWLVLRG